MKFAELKLQFKNRMKQEAKSNDAVGPKESRLHFPPWLVFVLALSILVGIFLRFYRLEDRFFWQDESFSMRQATGYFQHEIEEFIHQGRVFTNAELEPFKSPRVSQKTLWDMVKTSNEFPLNSILYHFLLRYWAKGVGDSIGEIRALSVLFGLLAFPCLFWLCKELFNSSQVGWVAVALFAVSPFHVLYAQEVRFYSLWTLLILLSAVALLYALRLNTKKNWILYAIATSFGFYSHFLFTLVFLGYGIYVYLSHVRDPAKIRNFLVYSFVGLLLFSPQIYLVLRYLPRALDASRWVTQSLPLSRLFPIASIGIASVFIDVTHPVRYFLENSFPGFIFSKEIIGFICLLFLWLIIQSAFFLVKSAPRHIWSFVVLLMAVTWVSFLLADIIFGGQRITVFRYLTPSYLGTQLSVAYFLSQLLGSTEFLKRIAGRMGIVSLLACGILSCLIRVQIGCPFSKQLDKFFFESARIIRQHPDALLIWNSYPEHLLSVSRYLDPRVKIIGAGDNAPELLETARQFSETFLVRNSDRKVTLKLFEKNGDYVIEDVLDPKIWTYGLHRLTKKK